MFKSIGFAVLFVFFLCFLQTASSQNCYVQLDEASGFDVSPYQADLNAKACELKAIFDSIGFADSFKVYSFGFYVEMEYYDGYSYPQAFIDRQEQVAQLSPYYLLIGRQSDHSGVFTRFWVDVKLPETGNFECLTQVDRNIIISKIKAIINNKHGQLEKHPNTFSMSETEGMDSLIAFVNKQIDCCYIGNRTVCNGCLTDDEIRFFLEDQGFSSITVDSSFSTLMLPKNDMVEDYAQVIAIVAGQEWDLHNSLMNDLDKAINKGFSAKGVIMDNENICLTDFMSHVLTGYYRNNYDFSILCHFWVKRNNEGQVIAEELFFKFNFIEIQMEEDDPALYEHSPYLLPQCSVPEPTLPTDPYIKHAISWDEPGSEVDGYWYIYHRDPETNEWFQGSRVDAYKPMSNHESLDWTWADCDNYSIYDFASHARVEMEWTTEKLLADFLSNTSKNRLLIDEHKLLAKQFTDEFIHALDDDGIKEFDCSSDVSAYFSTLPEMREYFDDVYDSLGFWLNLHGSVDGFTEQFEGKLTNVYYEFEGGMRPKNFNFPALRRLLGIIVVGGIQGWEFKIRNFRESPFGTGGSVYYIDIIATIIDRFGVGFPDRDATILFGAQPYPQGLTAMWILQHCRNYQYTNPPTFRPYITKIHVSKQLIIIKPSP